MLAGFIHRLSTFCTLWFVVSSILDKIIDSFECVFLLPDKSMMLRATKNIRYGEGKTTNTGDALSYTKSIMLSDRAGARENSTKIVVVVSDGRSQKTWLTQNIAKTMQEAGLHLFAVSVGFRLDHNELAGIASDPDDQYYFSIDKYSDMSYIKRTMEEKICETGEFFV